MDNKTPIEVHKARVGTLFGLDLKPMIGVPKWPGSPHRDDHYVFIIQTAGEMQIMIDFERVVLRGASLCFIAPGQIHHYLFQKQIKGWFLFVSPNIVANIYRAVFESSQNLLHVVSVQQNADCFNSIKLLEQLLMQENSVLQNHIRRSLAETIVGIIADQFLRNEPVQSFDTYQRNLLTVEFKKLVRQHFIRQKQVKEYAEMLHISPLYLNEVVKEVTGFTASYWIQQEILLEAKRLLYYTLLDAKQIAFHLGYEDHAYFSRFFKKNTGITPLAFRKNNHDLSNLPH